MDNIGSFGYGGTSLHYVENDVIAYTYGNAIKFYKISNGTSKTIVCTGKGITVFATNKKTNRYAYSERGYHPKIHIFSYPDHKKILTLEGNLENII